MADKKASPRQVAEAGRFFIAGEVDHRRRVKLVEFANKQSYSFNGSFEKQHDHFLVRTY